MPDSFDPYRDWLGIQDPQRPLDLYRLLDLKPFEDSEFRISTHAMMQLTAVMQHETGPQAEVARQLLNEVQAAQDVLTDAHRKQFYDDQLRRQNTDFALAPTPARSPAAKQPANAEQLAADFLSDDESCDAQPGVAEQHSNPRPDEAAPAADLGVQDDDDDDDDDNANLERATKSRLARKKRLAQRGAPAAAAVKSQADKPKPREEQKDDSYQATQLKFAIGGLIVAVVLLLPQFVSFNFSLGGGGDAKSDFLKMMDDPSPEQRHTAVQAVGNMGPDVKLVPRLFKVLRGDKVDTVRLSAAIALANARPDVFPLQSELDQLVSQERDPQVRAALEAARIEWKRMATVTSP